MSAALTALSRARSTLIAADIDVPAIAWKYVPATSWGVGVGVLPASTCTPVEVTSGLRYAPRGPREENAAITSPWPYSRMPAVKLA